MNDQECSRRLFPTSAEVGLPPLSAPHRHDDLSRIRVVDRDSPAGKEILRQRALRQAKRDVIDGIASASDATLATRLASA